MILQKIPTCRSGIPPPRTLETDKQNNFHTFLELLWTLINEKLHLTQIHFRYNVHPSTYSLGYHKAWWDFTPSNYLLLHATNNFQVCIGGSTTRLFCNLGMLAFQDLFCLYFRPETRLFHYIHQMKFWLFNAFLYEFE